MGNRLWSDFSWLKVDVFDVEGKPLHEQGGKGRRHLLSRFALAVNEGVLVHLEFGKMPNIWRPRSAFMTFCVCKLC